MAQWPEGPRGYRQRAGPQSYTVDANAAMWAFFLVHPYRDRHRRGYHPPARPGQSPGGLRRRDW